MADTGERVEMAGTDVTVIRDELVVELNGEDVTYWPSARKRPANNASHAKWVDYAVDLGMSRVYAEGMSVKDLKALDGGGE